MAKFRLFSIFLQDQNKTFMLYSQSGQFFKLFLKSIFLFSFGTLARRQPVISHWAPQLFSMQPNCSVYTEEWKWLLFLLLLFLQKLKEPVMQKASGNENPLTPAAFYSELTLLYWARTGCFQMGSLDVQRIVSFQIIYLQFLFGREARSLCDYQRLMFNTDKNICLPYTHIHWFFWK